MMQKARISIALGVTFMTACTGPSAKAPFESGGGELPSAESRPTAPSPVLPPAETSHAPEGLPTASGAPSSSPAAMAASPTSCASDADCVIAAWGCCSTLPTNRAHFDATLKKLQDPSRRYCPVKAACGRGVDGTDNGEPGLCSNGNCVLPK